MTKTARLTESSLRQRRCFQFPYRAVVMATIMFVLGSVLIVIGSLLMVGIIGPATEVGVAGAPRPAGARRPPP